mgnify:CR=1 FL=1
MRKGEGRAQQIRGHKRRKKILNMMKNRSGKTNTNQPGQVYWNSLVNDEAQKIKNEKISTESKLNTSQVNSVKPQVHRRKSGSA